MSESLKLIVREPAVKTPEAYARRVKAMACLLLGLFAFGIAGLAILCWRGRYFVTLSQRSNVETLTLAFLFVVFLYVVLLSRSGAWGAARIAWYSRPGASDTEKARRKMAALPEAASDPPTAGLTVVVEREGHGAEAFEIPVEDAHGRVGVMRFDGARMVFQPVKDHGGNNILAYTTQQMNMVRSERHGSSQIDIVVWKTIDDEAAEMHLGMVEFAQNLRKTLNSGPLWPSVQLSEDEIAKL